MGNLLHVERYILDLIKQGEDSLPKLYASTTLDLSYIIRVIKTLEKEKLILLEGEKLRSTDRGLELLTASKESLKYEVKEVLCGHVDHYFKEKKTAKLKLKQVWLSSEQRAHVDILFSQIDNYLQDITRRKQTSENREKHLLFWGENRYKDLIRNLI
jgi:predicted methyltransferase